MKIPVKTSYNKISMYGNSVAHGRSKQNAELQGSETVNKSIQKRPVLAARLNGSDDFKTGNNNQPSFTGDPKLITNIAKEAMTGAQNQIPSWAQKMGGSNWFKGVLHSVNKNEAFFEAFIALFVAGVMKPAFVLAMPGAEMEDKQMSATKNSVSAVLGFGLSNLILSPCSEAVNKITKSFDSQNPTKYIKDLDYINALKNENLLPGLKSTLGDSFKTTYKKFWDLGVSPLKAGMTIALTPVILKLLFGKDKAKKKPKEAEPLSLQHSTVFNAIRLEKNNSVQKTSFKGKENNNSPSFTGNINQNSPSFTGLNPKNILSGIGSGISIAKKRYNDILSEPIAKGMGLISNTNMARKIVEGTAHFEKPSPRWSDLTSVAITFFYVLNTYKSDKMDEDRKLPLMINNVMVTAASSAAAFLIDKYTDKPMENLLRGYLNKHGDSMLDKTKDTITGTLQRAITSNEAKETFNLESLKHHADDLLEGGIESLAPNMKKCIEELKNNEIVQKAIKKGLIEADDVAKMAVSNFESQASKVFKNISKAKSLTIFTITVRFLVTVLMTPVIGRVVAFVNKKLGKNKPKEQPKEHLMSKVQNPETLGMKDFMNMVKK